ncbi:MAG: acyltransferase family protein, partial [Rikenellaceae bacterium]
GYYLYSNLEIKGAKYLKKYIYRVIIIVLIWGCIHMFLFSVRYYYNLDCSLFTKLVKAFLNLTVSGGHSHLWFLPALVIDSILIFFVWKIKKPRLTFIICLLLFLTGCFLDRYYQFFDMPTSFENARNILGYIMLHPSHNLLFAGFPLMYLGMLIAKHPNIVNKNRLQWFVIAFLIFVIEFIALNFLFGNTMNPTTIYLTYPILLYFIVSYLMKDPWKELNNKVPTFFIITDLSLGIYLVHFIFINYLSQLPLYSISRFFIVLSLSLITIILLKSIFKGKPISRYF